MAASFDVLSFPLDFDVHSFATKTNKICVVAVVGQSRLNPFASKASMLNPVLDRDIFQGMESILGEKPEKKELECYYDEDTQVLYLHLLSHLDSPCLAHHCKLMATAETTEDFYKYWQDSEFRYAKMLLLIFCMSHIVLLVHPGSTLEVSYIKLFRILDSVRLKLQAPLCDMLRDLSVSKEWAATGRLCSPRVLFVFQTPAIATGPDDDMSSSSKARSQKLSPLKRLQHNLEDQIYRVLRKARVITNISNNSLFAVPANQEFVFVHCRKNEATEPVNFFLTLMRNNTGLDSPRKSYQTTRRGNSSNSSDSPRSPLMPVRQENSFKEFLWQHIEMAFTKGFDDNVGRNPVAARFELPSSSLWFEVCQQTHGFLFDATPEGRAQSALNSLRSLLDPDLRFSESRCSKIIPMAESAYQQDLPSFYVTAYHLSKLAQAKHVFAQYARGPAYEKYMKQLEDSCTAFWHAGRQQCEAISLSGNLCVNQLHRALCDTVTESTKDLPVMAHSSQLKTRAACNCGRQQADKDDPFDHRGEFCHRQCGNCGRQQADKDDPFDHRVSFVTVRQCGNCGRQQADKDDPFDHRVSFVTVRQCGNCGRQQADKDDPFDHRSANYDFFMTLEAGCCGTLQHIDMPVFKASTSQAIAAATTTPELAVEREAVKSADREAVSTGKADIVSGLSTLSLGLSLGQSGGSDFQHSHSPTALSPTSRHDPDLSQGHIDPVMEAEETEATVQETDAADKEGETATAPSEHEEEDDLPHGNQSTAETDLQVHQPFRQHSTTEYLPGMLHSNCPPGLLPKFPSWALCCLDSATVYSHQLGLDLPGFIPGSNFLLPWDIVVRSERERWPTINETTGKRGRGMRRMQKGPPEPAENTVRVYIGMEYECPRGHRFFCSAPDKVIKVLGNCSVKDTASRLVNLDMPLYTPCHCRSPKGYLAQLMRVYTLTPEAGVRVLLQPSVRPAPTPCPTFHPGTSEPIELPSGGIWVLRLPHVYMGENGPYNMPPDPQNLHACVLLKGLFGYRELSAEG
ncbi:hypothetical protein BaRGS_00014660 [Batillaria attramentaria]|uniref:Nonsense-mediated mRNA decay factor SMG8 n=1 Tax=Batillaria attramentaria TaxID=370345 RepID=A0ABD0L557_9CAEN